MIFGSCLSLPTWSRSVGLADGFGAVRSLALDAVKLIPDRCSNEARKFLYADANVAQLLLAVSLNRQECAHFLLCAGPHGIAANLYLQHSVLAVALDDVRNAVNIELHLHAGVDGFQCLLDEPAAARLIVRSFVVRRAGGWSQRPSAGIQE